MTFKKTLAIVLTFMLASQTFAGLVSGPNRSIGTPDEVIYLVGASYVKVDLRDYKLAVDQLGDDQLDSRYTVRVSRDADNEITHTDEVTYLGDYESANNTGRLEHVRWKQIMDYTVWINEDALGVEAVSQTDSFKIKMPWEVLNDPSTSSLWEIEANGNRYEFSAPTYHRFQAGDWALFEEERDEFIEHAGADEFHNLAQSLGAEFGETLASTAQIIPGLSNALDAAGNFGIYNSGSCVPPCFRCVGALLANIGSAIALISFCGAATVATGGAAALACVVAFLGHFTGHVIVMGACGSCWECSTGPGPDPGDGDEGEEEDPDQCPGTMVPCDTGCCPVVDSNPLL